MSSDGVVWVKLVQLGVQDSRATQIRYQNGGSFNVDDLCKAAKMEFGPLLAHVAASQLSVSATRDGPREARPSTLVQSLGGSSDEQPLYIHAPAAPPQGASPRPHGRVASVRGHGVPCVFCVLCVLGCIFEWTCQSEWPELGLIGARTEQRRRKRIRKVQRVQTPEHITGSSAVPSYSTTLLSLFAWWLPVASRESSKEGLPQQCLSSALSSASHAGSSSQCTAISSKAYSAAENAPLLAAHTTGGCTRRNQHAFSGD